MKGYKETTQQGVVSPYLEVIIQELEFNACS